MQVRKCRKLDMTRNMDLIRELLLRIEQDPRFDGTQWLQFDNSDDLGGHALKEVAYHLAILSEAGFLRVNMLGDGGGLEISRLTWQGHEFLDDIKDLTIWKRTKARIEGLPGVALTVIAEIAKAEIKGKLGLS